MKIGSIVERDPNYNGNMANIGLGPLPLFDKPYTVNWTRLDNGDLYIGLEETDQRDCYLAQAFRELLPPEAMQEQIKELLEEPVLI